METTRFYTLFLVLLLLSVSRTLFAQTAAKADDIIGRFFDKENGNTVEVYKLEQGYVGKVVAVGSGDAKVQVGTVLLKNLVYHGGAWKGQVYAPSRDEDFSVTVTLPDSTTMRLKVSIPIGSRKIEWQRVRQ